MRRLLLAGLLLAAAGCDRVPIDPTGTDLLLIDADLSVVFLQPDMRLRLVPDGPSGPLTLRIRDKAIDFDSTRGAFIYDKVLDRGLNVYPLSVTDEAGEVRRDTLYAVYLPVLREPIVGDAPEARIGAAAAPDDADALLTGGAGASGAALATATRVRVLGARLQAQEVPLLAARAGHTATPVGGGVLLLGGASTLSPGGPADFVRQAEWIGPGGRATAVTVVGDGGGPARMGHVARVVSTAGETYVYLLGGRVPAGAGTALSETVDVYRLTDLDPEAGTVGLERLTPLGGASGFAAVSGATLAPTGAESAVAAGLSGDGSGVALALRWSLPGTSTLPFSLGVAPAAPLTAARADAAAVDIGGGLALLIGGRDAGGQALGSFELYAAAPDRTFRFPEEVALEVPRAEHTATILGDGRILVIGGRSASGGPIGAAEAFRL